MSTSPSSFNQNKLELGMDIINRLTKRRAPIRPTLKSVLAELEPLPSQSVVIGACDDGLPILMDMSNPLAGSILIIADAHSGKAGLLASILNSASATNPPRSLRISFISSRPTQLSNIARLPHTYMPGSSEATIDEFCAVADDRHASGIKGPAILLAIDDLPQLVSHLEPEMVEKLAWLVKNGPAMQVKIIATTESSQLTLLDEKMVDAFGAWLVGKTEVPQGGAKFHLLPQETSRSLQPGFSFACIMKTNGSRSGYCVET